MSYSVPRILALLVFTAVSVIGASSVCKAEDASDIVVLSETDEITLSENDMDTSRGAYGVNTLMSSQSMASTTSDNVLNVGGNLTNGDIALGSNFGGIGSYVMNTGNNSTINSAVSLNVQIMPTL